MQMGRYLKFYTSRDLFLQQKECYTLTGAHHILNWASEMIISLLDDKDGNLFDWLYAMSRSIIDIFNN